MSRPSPKVPSVFSFLPSWKTNKPSHFSGRQDHRNKCVCFCCPVSCFEFYCLWVKYNMRTTWWMLYSLGQQLPLVKGDTLSLWRCSIMMFFISTINDGKMQSWEHTHTHRECQTSNGATLCFVLIDIREDYLDILLARGVISTKHVSWTMFLFNAFLPFLCAVSADQDLGPRVRRLRQRLEKQLEQSPSRTILAGAWKGAKELGVPKIPSQ